MIALRPALGASMAPRARRARRAGRGAAVLALLLLAVACGGDGVREPVELSEIEQRDTAPDAVRARAIDPETVGGVRGRVRFDGEPPARREIPLVRECRLHDEPLRTEDVVVGAGGGLQDVLVHVRRGLAAWEIPPPPPDAPAPVLDQVGCRYVPHVLALRAGQTLEVRNSDPLTHNVRVRAPRNGLDSNRSQARGAAAIELEFRRTELGVRVGCDLHPWMAAVVHSLDHPFFALTGPGGDFAIAGLPPGEYELEALHPTLGKRRATVPVEAGGGTALELVFPGG